MTSNPKRTTILRKLFNLLQYSDNIIIVIIWDFSFLKVEITGLWAKVTWFEVNGT